MKENAVWVVPIIVAIITGVVALIKKRSSSSVKQINKNIINSQITQTGGDNQQNNDKR